MVKGKIRPMDEVSDEEAGEIRTSLDHTNGSGKTVKTSTGAKRIHSMPEAEPENVDEIHKEVFGDAVIQRPRRDNLKTAGYLLIVIGVILIFPAYQLLTVSSDTYIDALSNSGADMTIYGNIVDGNGTELDGVSVRLKNKEFNTTTDELGGYTLKNVPPGRYIVVVSKVNYTTIEHKILLEGGLGGTSDSSEMEIPFTLNAGNGTEQTGSYDSEIASMIGSILKVCGSLYFIAIAVIITAGYFALKHSKYGLVMIGCIMGIIFGIPSPILIGTILSVIATVLVYSSKNDFR